MWRFVARQSEMARTEDPGDKRKVYMVVKHPGGRTQGLGPAHSVRQWRKSGQAPAAFMDCAGNP